MGRPCRTVDQAVKQASYRSVQIKSGRDNHATEFFALRGSQREQTTQMDTSFDVLVPGNGKGSSNIATKKPARLRGMSVRLGSEVQDEVLSVSSSVMRCMAQEINANPEALDIVEAQRSVDSVASPAAPESLVHRHRLIEQEEMLFLGDEGNILDDEDWVFVPPGVYRGARNGDDVFLPVLDDMNALFDVAAETVMTAISDVGREFDRYGRPLARQVVQRIPPRYRRLRQLLKRQIDGNGARRRWG
jgi:hypothetical protein